MLSVIVIYVVLLSVSLYIVIQLNVAVSVNQNSYQGANKNTSYVSTVTGHFRLSLIIEGATEKVLSYMMPVRSIYRKKFVLMNKNVFFEYCREVTITDNLYNGCETAINRALDGSTYPG